MPKRGAGRGDNLKLTCWFSCHHGGGETNYEVHCIAEKRVTGRWGWTLSPTVEGVRNTASPIPLFFLQPFHIFHTFTPGLLPLLLLLPNPLAFPSHFGSRHPHPSPPSSFASNLFRHFHVTFSLFIYAINPIRFTQL